MPAEAANKPVSSAAVLTPSNWAMPAFWLAPRSTVPAPVQRNRAQMTALTAVASPAATKMNTLIRCPSTGTVPATGLLIVLVDVPQTTCIRPSSRMASPNVASNVVISVRPRSGRIAIRSTAPAKAATHTAARMMASQ